MHDSTAPDPHTAHRQAELDKLRAEWGDLVQIDWAQGEFTAHRHGSRRLGSPTAHGLVRLLEERYGHGR